MATTVVEMRINEKKTITKAQSSILQPANLAKVFPILQKESTFVQIRYGVLSSLPPINVSFLPTSLSHEILIVILPASNPFQNSIETH